MHRASTRVSLAAAAILCALAALALSGLAQPALADEPPPTPLPEAVSGPSVDTLLALARGLGLECITFTAPGGEEWSCHREITRGVFYSVQFPTIDPLVLQAFVSGPLPWPDDHDQFFYDFASPFCEFTSTENILSFIPLSRDSGTEGLTFDDRACRLQSDYNVPRADIAFQQLNAFAKVDPATLSSPLPSTLPTAPPPLATPTFALPTAAPTAAPSPAPVIEPTIDPGRMPPTGFVQSIPTPAQVSSEPLVIAQSLALAGLIVLLMPFPAQLFNSTLETHYATVRRWFRLDALQRAAGRASGFWDSLVGVMFFVLLSAIIYALLDPSVGVDARGAATILGLAIGIVVTSVIASAPSLIDALRNNGKWRLRGLPATLLIGLACVLISRLTGFLPGYLYGVVLGFVFARELTRAEQGRANGLAAALMLVMALIAWLALTAIGPDPDGFVAVLMATALTTLLVAGLEAVVFGLLPFRFLPGEPLHATNRLLWAVLLLVGAFCFFHILINPASGYLSSTSRTPLLTIVVLFLAFGLISVVFWAYFRNKPPDAENVR